MSKLVRLGRGRGAAVAVTGGVSALLGQARGECSYRCVSRKSCKCSDWFPGLLVVAKCGGISERQQWWVWHRGRFSRCGRLVRKWYVRLKTGPQGQDDVAEAVSKWLRKRRGRLAFAIAQRDSGLGNYHIVTAAWNRRTHKPLGVHRLAVPGPGTI